MRGSARSPGRKRTVAARLGTFRLVCAAQHHHAARVLPTALICRSTRFPGGLPHGSAHPVSDLEPTLPALMRLLHAPARKRACRTCRCSLIATASECSARLPASKLVMQSLGKRPIVRPGCCHQACRDGNKGSSDQHAYVHLTAYEKRQFLFTFIRYCTSRRRSSRIDGIGPGDFPRCLFCRTRARLQ